MRLTSFGDVLLDVIVRLERPLVAGDDTRGETRTGPGGQAANVAAWAASLGAQARFVGKRGADAAGELLAGELTARGVELAGPVAGRTGVVVSLTAVGDRTMASDRGSAPELLAQELEDAWFDCDVLHISGYAIAEEPIASAAAHAARAARARGATVSLDVSAWSLVDDAFRERARSLAADVVFATEHERDALGPLATRWVVKHGAGGMTVDGRDWPAQDADVVDTTGAGDALAAGFLVGGPDLALEAAARCCAQLGAMP
jgi:sugar/nucleoside kinase (ribokinase family)